jgi:hypothetical protein
MSIRRTILTSGGLASAIGVCLAILSAGTLVVFSAVAARVGLGDLPNDASMASPRNAAKRPPAAITFPSTQEPSEATGRTAATSNAPLLDIIGSALDASTSSEELAGPASPNASGVSNDVGSEQVGALVSDIDAAGRNLLSTRRSSASRPKLPGGDARSGNEDDEPKDEKDNDRVAARKDDEAESDHGDDEDDDDDGDSSGSRHGSRDGSRDGNRSGSRGRSGDGSRDGHGATHVRVKAAKAKARALGHSRDDVVGAHSHRRDDHDDGDSSND